jgi:RNA polymerase sigma-70 factor, ECF subfamily
VNHATPAETRDRVDRLYRSESRRVLATLIRLLGDSDLAEEALQDAFAAAMAQWPRDGTPANPRAWLISTGRFRAIDRLGRRARFEAMLGELAARLEQAAPDPTERDDHLEDDRLRLIFTCCHPALPPDAQVAMTLREVCGLTTEEIARAFLPYAVPPPAELPQRRFIGRRLEELGG